MADNIILKVRMEELGITRYDLVRRLEEIGVLPSDGGHNNYVTLSYALSGKRKGKRYTDMLSKCLEITNA